MSCMLQLRRPRRHCPTDGADLPNNGKKRCGKKDCVRNKKRRTGNFHRRGGSYKVSEQAGPDWRSCDTCQACEAGNCALQQPLFIHRNRARQKALNRRLCNRPARQREWHDTIEHPALGDGAIQHADGRADGQTEQNANSLTKQRYQASRKPALPGAGQARVRGTA